MPTRRQLIQKITLNAPATTVSFNNIPQNYTDLVLYSSVRANGNSGYRDYACRMTINNLTTNIYTTRRLYAGISGTGASDVNGPRADIIWAAINSSLASSNTFTYVKTHIPNYTSSSNKNMMLSVSSIDSTSGIYIEQNAVSIDSSSAISSIQLFPTSSVGFAPNSTFYLYGITHVPIIRGGEVSIAGGYKIHTFKSSGSLQVIEGGQVEYLVIAGGGGGSQGGGGAGGYRSSVGAENSGGGILSEPKCMLAPNKYTITVGGGGNGGPYFNAGVTGGSDSSISGSGLSSITSIGGGRGANGYLLAGGTGGSGGGGSFNNVSLGSGTTGQGYSGGAGFSQNDAGGGGGGGGASSAGSAATRVGTENANGGNGGNGVSSSITGSAITRAGGGGGRAQGPGTVGAGGSGGGGAGTKTDIVGESGVVNTGSGGGGTGSVNGVITGGAGGSGIVIIRYPYDGN